MADAKKKSWWSKLVSKLGFGGKYAQKGSKVSTTGTVGDGMASMTISAVRNRNANIAKQMPK